MAIVENKKYNGVGISPSLCGPMLVQFRKTTLSAAESIALHDTPQLLVPAPGAGKAIEFVGGTVNMHGGTTDGVGVDGDLIIKYRSGVHDAGDGAVVSTTQDDFMNDATAGSIMSFKAIVTDYYLEANQPLYVCCDVDIKASTCDRLVSFNIFYRIIDVLT